MPEPPSSPTLASSQSVRACTPRHSPKREHGEIEEEETSAQRKKCRTTLAAEPPSALETNVTSTKAATPLAAISDRPSRTRKPPKAFWVADEGEKKSAKPTSPAKKATSRVFDPVFITSNSASRLGKADVFVSRRLAVKEVGLPGDANAFQHMLLEDHAWTSLTTSQQKTLLSMLPYSPENQKSLDRIAAGDANITRPQAFTLSNDCFRTDVAKFKEDLRNGHLAKSWQAAAEKAVAERANGTYDKWKAEEAEMWWGQKST